jgi:hypothetical protein
MAHAPGSDILPAHHRPTGQSADISLSDHAYDLGSVELSSLSTPDQQTLLRAVEDARRILGEYIEPGHRDPTRTVQSLLAVLDKNEVVHALDRMKRRRVMRLVE